MNDTIEIFPYNSLWPKMFEDEARLIQKALGPNCIEIHHIGSTAVPELIAKPIIDILPVVSDISIVDKVTTSMENIGYEAKGEKGIPFRRFFLKGNPVRKFHVHIFEKDNPEIERHLKFRDWLKEHDDDRNAYAQLKSSLAQKYSHDRLSYTIGKNEIIANIDKKAGFNKPRILMPLSEQEWQSVRHFRQSYFFDKASIQDPYTWTFNHSDHLHLVLYQEAKIIGYAHIQLWKDNRAALRIIVIDEPYQRKSLGSYFLTFIEKWLKSKGIIKLQIQARADVYSFYAQHQYIEMPFNDPANHESDPNDIEIGKNLYIIERNK
jgi:GrpB-like predicted nucleotidyltransferase (UPF0157 family)/GNAT superfamily N-acetyltransferase